MPVFTGYQRDGGFAEYAVADARFCFAIPPELDDVAVAPLLCAGLIGYRSLRDAGDADARALRLRRGRPPVTQVARHEGRRVFAFTRPGDDEAQRFALELGAEWAGPSDAAPPEPLEAAILFAPVGALVPAALRAVDKGGVVVCGGIHMSDVPSFPYRILWEERLGPLGRQPHPPRCRGAARPRPPRSAAPAHRGVRAGAGSRGAGAPAARPAARVRGARDRPRLLSGRSDPRSPAPQGDDGTPHPVERRFYRGDPARAMLPVSGEG